MAVTIGTRICGRELRKLSRVIGRSTILSPDNPEEASGVASSAAVVVGGKGVIGINHLAKRFGQHLESFRAPDDFGVQICAAVEGYRDPE
jgi:hypothetical protein